jgi:hypothetical protein
MWLCPFCFDPAHGADGPFLVVTAEEPKNRDDLARDVLGQSGSRGFA